MPWPPTTFERFEHALATSTQTCQVVTDAGRAYLKCLGNRQGPHVLACEWVGTRLARWFELKTFDVALFPISQDDEIPIAPGKLAFPGRSFASRKERGNTWGGDAEELEDLHNAADIPRLVVFDTWTLNCDRHPPTGMDRRPNFDNVFLSRERSPSPVLIAMDHSHCFTCGNELTQHLAAIDRVKDPRVYGLFPAFVGFMLRERVEAAVAKLKTLSVEIVRDALEEIPVEWQVEGAARTALADLILGRAVYVAENIIEALQPICWPFN